VDSRAEAEALPAVLYVPDLAALLRISEKAVRHRAARGLVPPPVKLGRALAWTREVVLEWLRDSGRGGRNGRREDHPASLRERQEPLADRHPPS
jgi:predicted DNA-binding transcriptional regulator AlpA